MKVNRLLAILFTLAFFAVVLTACGSSADSDSDGPTPTRRATPTPTSDHTPTVAPESPEEQDFVAIGRFFDSAEKICANPDTTPGEGSRFLLRFEDDHITPDLVMSDSGYQRRIWESWIRSAGLTGTEYKVAYEPYRANSKFGCIKGTLQSDGTIQWTAENLDEALFTRLEALGVVKDPAYLARLALFEEIKGNWYGTVNLYIDYIVDLELDKSDTESRRFYRNINAFLQNYGFPGYIKAEARINVMTEKEIVLEASFDTEAYLNAIRKATATKDGMTRFLCTAYGVSEEQLNAALRQQGTDVTKITPTIVKMMEQIVNQNNVTKMLYTYDIEGDVIALRDTYDKFTYNRKNNTIIYKYEGVEMTMHRQE